MVALLNGRKTIKCTGALMKVERTLHDIDGTVSVIRTEYQFGICNADTLAAKKYTDGKARAVFIYDGDTFVRAHVGEEESTLSFTVNGESTPALRRELPKALRTAYTLEEAAQLSLAEVNRLAHVPHSSSSRGCPPGPYIVFR